MQVTVESVSELGRKMTITVEDANIEQAVQKRLASIRPSVRMAGFRPGKVPMKMLVKTHGPQHAGKLSIKSSRTACVKHLLKRK